MGIFKALKSIFNKNIECGHEIDDHMVFLLKKKRIYLGKNIIVRDGLQCVLVYKDRICDVLLPGKYKLSKETVPLICDKINIDKWQKKGRKIKKIKAQIFYVNTREFSDFVFTSNVPFYVKSPEIGKVKGCLEGTCTARVLDSALFIRTMFSKCRKVTTDIIYKTLGELVGNKINKRIEKNKIPTNAVLCNNSQVESMLNREMEDSFDNIGIYIKNIKLKAVKFKKRHQVKVNEYLSKHQRLVKTPTVQGVNLSDKEKVAINIGRNNQLNSQYVNNVKVGTNMFRTCRTCGAKNNIDSIYCNKCGNRL